MKRTEKTKHCYQCHLTRFNPTKPVVKTLFIGTLKRGVRKHELVFKMDDEDLLGKKRVQVRCFRAKEEAKNTILFPDSFEMSVNGSHIKTLEPLHKQSSLKFRKDEPFFIEFKHLHFKENKIVIQEKIALGMNHDKRIDLENHVIGFFIAEDRKVEHIIRDVSLNKIISFEESQALMRRGFVQE